MIRIAMAASVAFISCGTVAAAYPERPITLIVPFSAGGPTDVVARNIAVAMGKDLGQTVVVENRPSTGGIVGSEAVVNARPDGYTLLIHNIGMSTLKALSKDLKFDPQRDFKFVGQIVDVPMTLVGSPKLPPKTFADLRGYLKDHQKTINLSNAGIGTASHLCGLMLMNQLGLALTTVPYKGAAPAMTDLQGSQVDLLCDQVTTTVQPIMGGRVQAYGTTTQARLAVLPDLATLSEQGLDNFEVTVWHGLYAPKDTPAAVQERLSQSLQSALKDANFRASMEKLGAVPVSEKQATPGGLEQRLREQTATWAPLIERSKAYLD
jgi:tripartite-type tricarboxylate transporter receptor subunit TctC